MAENIYGSLLPQNNNIYNIGETALQSNAISGQIFGGTASQRQEAAGLINSGGSGLNVGNAVNMGISTAQQLIPGASSNPYLNAAKNNPLMKAGLKTMNPVIFGAGLLSTAFLGNRAKKQQDQIKKQTDVNTQNQQVLAEGVQSKKNEISDFYAGQRKAAGNAYGINDIDNFLQQNRV
tara:strand:+ start:10191 stop:10724 length:534 start_codon:yes stop_codon:yes gene_type:complete